MDQKSRDYNIHLPHVQERIHPDPIAAIMHNNTAHEFPVHAHTRFYVFALIKQGRCVCFDKKEKSPKHENIAEKGDLVIINPGQPHSGYPVESERYSYKGLYVNSSYLNLLVYGDRKDSPSPVFFPSILKNFRYESEYNNCVDKLIPTADLEHHKFHQMHEIEPTLEESLIQFISLLADMNTVKLPVHEQRETDEVISKISGYITEHLTTKISLDTMSLECGRSKYHLVRTFKAATGIPPLQFQQQERISKAKGLLKTGKDLADIAYELGYYDQSHFQNSFKSFTGITPSQYLKGQT